jgi:hypothetical protein
MSWPEALELLSAELGEPVTFRGAAERQFLDRLTGAGVPARTAELRLMPARHPHPIPVGGFLASTGLDLAT